MEKYFGFSLDFTFQNVFQKVCQLPRGSQESQGGEKLKMTVVNLGHLDHLGDLSHIEHLEDLSHLDQLDHLCCLGHTNL